VPVVAAEALTGFATALLEAAGVPAANARLMSSMLVGANLRGIDSHGVHLLSYYLKHIDAGTMDPLGEGRVASESGACLTYDGENSLGQVTAAHCTAHAIRLANEYGLGLVTAREANHFGACYWWAREIATGGRLALVLCNASTLVAPWQGREPRFGTNPICFAVPPVNDGEEPFLLDMATTTVAANRIFKAWINHDPEVPTGWAMDSDGVPTTNTEAAYKGLVMPLGGYKGYGLAVMVEILTSVLAAGAPPREVGGIRFPGKPVRVSHAYLAIDIARFQPLEEFQKRIQDLVAWLKSAALAKGFEEILVAGEPERRIEKVRLASGIPIPEGNWRDLLDAAARLDVAPPAIT
jgi:LDH2 family malate/lactate/ureidoglycolate dehydrogenase